MTDLAGQQEAPLALPLVSASGVTKTYGGAFALRGVSISIMPGEVHGLVGANGAGKSTLIKILAGLTSRDAGAIAVDGKPATIATPMQAADLGMSFIHQELAFVPGMTVIENIMLGLPKASRLGLIDWKAVTRDVLPIMKRLGITAPLHAQARHLSTAENWLVSIARSLVRKARLIVMDEPTASLSDSEASKLLAIIKDLAASGVAVLYVSHRLDEILELCNRVTVFRDGRSVAELAGKGLNRTSLVEAIVGGAVESLPKASDRSTKGGVVLSVRGLSRLPRVIEANLDLHRGEVLGLGGLVGAGRTELVRLLYGADRPDRGTMRLDGKPFAPRSPVDAVKAGFGLVPEERRTEGLLLTKSVAFNMSLARLGTILSMPPLPFISFGRRASLTERMIRDLAIKAQSPNQPVGRLSGGNQQKVMIGRWLEQPPKVLILDEPTRGVDVGARTEIHLLIRKLASEGMAVLVVSSEPDELPDLCDRVLVMAEGRVVRELSGEAVTRNAIIEASYASHAMEATHE